MDAPDSELMKQLAAGEDLALNALMSRWSGRVVAFLFRMTGQRESAVDLAQETFVKLYQARHRYRPQGQFSTWLFAEAALAREKTAAVNAAILALPLELREALTLFVHEEMSYAQIAELAHCSPKAVETRIYRARLILKEQLKDL